MCMGKIVIRTLELPDYDRPEEVIEWFCAALGFSSSPAVDSIEGEILEQLARAAYGGRGVSSSEFKFKKQVARSTVIYHLNQFIDAGLVVKRGRKYYLRATEMSKTIEEIEYDIQREMNRMLSAAREFDKLMERRLGR